MFKNLCNLQYLHEIYADEEGPDNPQRHRKGENIRHKGNQKPNEAPNLQNSPHDEEIIKAWSLGLRESQESMRGLGISPHGYDEHADQDKWFYHPHEIDATTKAGMFEQMWQDNDNLDLATDEVKAGNRYDVPLVDQANNMAGNLVDEYTGLALHLRQIADQDNSESSSQSQTNTDTVTDSSAKHKLTIKVSGAGEIHKSTVCSLINANPEGVSKDRLKRVKSKVTAVSTHKGSAALNNSNDLCLFDDIAFFMKDKGQPPCYGIAHVIRMRNKSKSTVEYKKPVSLLNRKRFAGLHLLTHPYEEDGEQYVYISNKTTDVLFGKVIMKVKLTVQDNGNFALDSGDRKSLKEFITNISGRNTRKMLKNTACIYRKQLLSNSNSEGRVVIPVESAVTVNGNETEGVRKSKRKRKAIIYEIELYLKDSELL